MIGTSLSLTQSPPLSVPARFFITAPVFGMLTGLLAALAGTAGLSGRWMPAVLAATHLLTLGYMGMIMLGALMQVFPVVIGHPFRYALRVSRVVHACLTLGVLLLAAGFLAASPALFLASLFLLAAALLTFLTAAGRTLVDVEAWGDTARAIALALAAFAVMSGLGVWLALGHTSYAELSRTWTNIHAGWGLAGWVPLLLMGVAYQVVPMFQLTPPYPAWLRRGFPVTLFAMLLVATLAHGFGLPHWVERLAHTMAGVVLAGFAVTTLALQRRSRRSRREVTVAYWRVGMLCLIVAVTTWLAGQWLPAVRTDPRFALFVGALMIPGFALSVINGMLYKIVPFLVWLHLALAPASPAGPAAGKVPGVKRIIPEKRAWLQFKAHVLALLLILSGVLGIPGALPVGAIVFTAASACLGYDILNALRLYRRKARPTDTGTAERPERVTTRR